jgi:hypothetical protein
MVLGVRRNSGVTPSASSRKLGHFGSTGIRRLLRFPIKSEETDGLDTISTPTSFLVEGVECVALRTRLDLTCYPIGNRRGERRSRFDAVRFRSNASTK